MRRTSKPKASEIVDPLVDARPCPRCGKNPERMSRKDRKVMLICATTTCWRYTGAHTRLSDAIQEWNRR